MLQRHSTPNNCPIQEVGGRAMAEVPHPFVAETMQRFSEEPLLEKKKLTLIHLNHANPLYGMKQREQVYAMRGSRLRRKGCLLACRGSWRGP